MMRHASSNAPRPLPLRLTTPALIHSPAALVEEMLGALREEVKEMDRTNWLYEVQDPSVTMRVKI